MDSLSLSALTDELLRTVRSSPDGRTARTVRGGHEHPLRQVVMALAADRLLDEHDNPGQATLQVLAGWVRLRAGEETWEGRAGDYVVIPQCRHSVEGLEDSVFLLTAVTLPPRPADVAASNLPQG